MADALLRLRQHTSPASTATATVTVHTGWPAELAGRHPGTPGRTASSIDKPSALLPDSSGDGPRDAHRMVSRAPRHRVRPRAAAPWLWVADIDLPAIGHRCCPDATRAAGCRTSRRWPAAVYQAVDAFALITGRTPDAAMDDRPFPQSVTNSYPPSTIPQIGSPLHDDTFGRRRTPIPARPRDGAGQLRAAPSSNYDFFLFPAAALIFPHIFFPKDDTAALVMSFMTFGFAARRTARRCGHPQPLRRPHRTPARVLMFTLVLMGLSTFPIGCPRSPPIGWGRPGAAGAVSPDARLFGGRRGGPAPAP